MNDRPIRQDRTVNLALHVWLDAPGIWDELVHIADPDMGFPAELVEAATYLMGRGIEEIEIVGWRVLEDDALWSTINRSLRSSIIEVAKELRASNDEVVSSVDGQTQA